MIRSIIFINILIHNGGYYGITRIFQRFYLFNTSLGSFWNNKPAFLNPTIHTLCGYKDNIRN